MNAWQTILEGGYAGVSLATSHLTALSSYLGGPDVQHAERVDELEGAEEILRHWDLARVLGAALEGPNSDGTGVEINVLTMEREAVGDPSAGVRQGECDGLVGGLPPEQRGSLVCTNMIESVYSVVRQVCRYVKRWRNARMALRWTGAGMLEAQKGQRCF